MPSWFLVDRREDVGGVSGTGVVAFLLELPSGCFMFWDTGWPTFEWLPNRRTVEEIHGHNGRTILVPLEDDDPRVVKAYERARVIPDVMETVRDWMHAWLDGEL